MKVIAIAIVIFASLAFAANIQEAEIALKSAEKGIREMSAAGFAVLQINETFNRAKALFLSGDYDSVLFLTNQINNTKEKAFAVSGKIDEVDSGIVEISNLVDTAEVRENLRLATIEFYKENYLGAENYADKALKALEALKSGVSVKSVSEENRLVSFISDNSLLLAFILMLLITYRLVFYRRMKIKRMQHRLQQLDEMEKRTRDAVEKLQQDYFAHGDISKYDYHIKMNTYRKHLGSIRKERLIVSRELEPSKYKNYQALEKSNI